MAHEKLEEAVNDGAPGRMFCDEPTCLLLAQTGDVTHDDVLKFKCPAHEAQARERGESGKRRALPESLEVFGKGSDEEVPRKFKRTSQEPAAGGGSEGGTVVEMDVEGKLTGRRWAGSGYACKALALGAAGAAIVEGAIRRGEVLRGRRYRYVQREASAAAGAGNFLGAFDLQLDAAIDTAECNLAKLRKMKVLMEELLDAKAGA